MITIISDLHLTDESTSFNVKPEAFSKVFKKYVLGRALESDGKAAVKELNIVLLGDIFDLVRTSYWLTIPRTERPWNGTIDKRTAMNSDTNKIESHYKIVLNKILQTPAAITFIKTLNEIKQAVNMVDCKITYVVGNHDRAINCFDSLKEIVKAALAEAFSIDEIEFRNEIYLQDYTLLCRHGHEYDETNYGYKLYLNMNDYKGKNISPYDADVYKVQSIGEVITCELMAGLVYELENDGVTDDFLSRFKDINNVRPLSDSMHWISWFGKGPGCADPSTKKKLMNALTKCIREVLNTDLAQKWDELQHEFWIFNMDITDELEKLLGIINGKSFDDASSLVDLYRSFDRIFGSNKDEFEKGAEQIASGDSNIQYIVMGHTHLSKHVFINGTPDDKIQVYINTGTFLPFVEKTVSENGFVYSHQISYATIFKTNEDIQDTNRESNPFPTMELWDGIKKKRY